VFILVELTALGVLLGGRGIGRRRWASAEGVEAAEFGDPGADAAGGADFIVDTPSGLEEERGGVDEAGKNLGRDLARDGVLGDACEVSVDFGGGTEFACRAEEIGDFASVEG